MTSAAETAFCADKIEGPGGHIWIDGNGKITASRGSLANPKPNAFSLAQIDTCPMRTPTCESSCYVHGLQKHAPKIHEMYVHNTRMMRDIVRGNSDGFWADAMAQYIRKNCPDFRWHVSGDIFSIGYAKFIAGVCSRTLHTTKHWIYTRSFALMEPLLYVRNLELNLSADRDNLWLAKRYHEETGKRICYMASDTRPTTYWLQMLVDCESLPDDSVIFPDYPLRGKGAFFESLSKRCRKMLCPVDTFGKSEKRRCGVCRKCMKP